MGIAMEAEAMEDGDSCSSFLALAGYPSFLAWVAFPFLPVGAVGKKMPARIRKNRSASEKVEKYGELKSCKEYLSEFKDALSENSFFGGERPAATDVSLFATFKAFETIPYTRRVLQESGLADWYRCVEERMPQSIGDDIFE